MILGLEAIAWHGRYDSVPLFRTSGFDILDLAWRGLDNSKLYPPQGNAIMIQSLEIDIDQSTMDVNE